jgi:hypothetical protein
VRVQEYPDALHESLRIVEALRSGAAPYPRSRLACISEQLGSWLNVRKGQEVSDAAGLRMRDWLMRDISIGEKIWKPAAAPSTAKAHA